MSMENSFEMLGRMLKALEILEKSRDFARLIPGVRSNLVYAKKGAESSDDVIGFDGRITIVKGMPYAPGRPVFGGSRHMGALLAEIHRQQPDVRTAINLVNAPDFESWLRKYAAERKWIFASIDRARNPDSLSDPDKMSLKWKVAEYIRLGGGKMPKIFYETGVPSREPVIIIIGEDPVEVAEEAVEIATMFAKTGV